MKVLLNYANQSYQALQQRNSSTGREVAGFDQVL